MLQVFNSLFFMIIIVILIIIILKKIYNLLFGINDNKKSKFYGNVYKYLPALASYHFGLNS